MAKFTIEIPELTLAKWTCLGTSLEVIGTHILTEDELVQIIYNGVLTHGFKGGSPVVKLDPQDIKVRRTE